MQSDVHEVAFVEICSAWHFVLQRNYHIFYLLTNGSQSDLKDNLKLDGSFNYLSNEADNRGTDPASVQKAR